MSNKTFQIRGPITDPDQSIYIERPEGKKILDLILNSIYVTMLGARQTGKTSLLYKLRDELASRDFISALVTLHPVSKADRPQFYRFVSDRIKEALHIDQVGQHTLNDASDPITFLDFLKEITETVEPNKRIVVMLDEFEAVPDDLKEQFFGAIRTVYNERGIQAEFERYVFVLAGATSPDSLIPPESMVSPFNISERVYIGDFDLEGVWKMVGHLEGLGSESESLAENIYNQTHGHPYLSSRLCNSIKYYPETSVEDAVEELITSGDGNISRLINVLEQDIEVKQWVRKIYRREENVRFDRNSSIVAQLELLGVIRRREDGNCVIRSQIYEKSIHLLLSEDNPDNGETTVSNYMIFGALFGTAALLVLILYYLWE